jgi:hypothetical protein
MKVGPGGHGREGSWHDIHIFEVEALFFYFSFTSREMTKFCDELYAFRPLRNILLEGELSEVIIPL